MTLADIRIGTVRHRPGQDSSAREALEFLSDGHAFGCLVIDLMMPGVDGATMLEELEQRGIEIPVVLMSGFTATNVSDLLRRRCVSSFFEKPFGANELVKVIIAAMSRPISSVATTLQRRA